MNGSSAALRGKRIFLTGADGYIGTMILQQLRDVDCELRALVPPTDDGGEPPELPVQGPGRTKIITGDLRKGGDFGAWLDGVDVVIHLAGQTSHYEANKHPTDDLAINV